MRNISFLLGAGFSVNQVYPTANVLNKKNLDLTEFEYSNIIKSRLDFEFEKASQMGFSNNWIYNVK